MRPSLFLITAALLLVALTATADPAPAPKPAPIPWNSGTNPAGFPKDNPAGAFADLKIYDAKQIPVRVPKEDWDGAKKRIADPEWAKWLAEQRSSMDEWMAKRQDKVEWICGWWHNFVSPKDGSFLTFEPDEPTQNTPLHSPSDPNVTLTPKLHDAWVYCFRTKQCDMMLQAARLYRVTGDVKYAQWTASQLDFYADNYLKWPEQTKLGHSRLMGQPLDEAVDLCKYVQAARTLGGYVTSQEKKRWTDGLFEPEADLLQHNFQFIHNIACWCRSAEAHVAIYCNDDKLWKEAVDDPNGIRDQVARGVTSDYFWYEQSLGYNNYVVMALDPFFTYAQQSGRGASLLPEMETIENLMLSPIGIRFPTGQLPNPADAGAATKVPNLNILASFVQLYPTKLGLAHLTGEKNWTALLDPLDDLAGSPPPTDPVPVTSHSFESTRWAIIRNGPWQAYFHYGQLTNSHAQSEALNFEAFYNDTDITHDPGTVGYGSPFSSEYYRTGLCHNVALVDGAGQKPWDPGNLDSFTDTSVTASQPKYLPNATASRTLTIDGGQLLDTSTVTTTDGAPHALGFLLHVNGKAQLPAGFAPDPNYAKIEPVTGFKYWQDATRSTGKDHAAFDVAFDKVTLHVTFDLPGDFTIWHASVPDYPPHRHEVFYLETHGQAATLKTTLAATPKS